MTLSRQDEIRAYYWQEYKENGWPGDDDIGDWPLIFTISKKDRRKFPELNKWNTYVLWRTKDGRLISKRSRERF